jgi:uncharacterized protein (UPF0276 family)
MPNLGLDRLGVGLGYRPELRSQIWAHREDVDFIEVISEGCFRPAEAEALAEVARSLPVVCHGLHLSVGTAEPLDDGYVGELRQMRAKVQPIWLSDHLAMTRIGNFDFGHLAPLEFTTETVRLVSDKVKNLSAKVSPFLLENITYYFALPDAEMTEAQFITAILESADCGLLLDLNNLYVNSRNHGYDPYMFMDQIPLDRVVEVHLAGGLKRGDLWVDTHGEAVPEEVWEYLAYLCARTDVPALLLERDQNFGTFEELVAELRRARSILTNSGAADDEHA